MNPNDAWNLLNHAELLHGATEIELALDRLASRIGDALADTFPIALCVMGGGVVFAGKLLPRLGFPLEFDYLHATRYRSGTRGGEIEWAVLPRTVESRLYLAMAESVASEHSARRMAMHNATENCKELTQQLTLDINKARQASITKELGEIVGGAEALKG